MITLPSTPSPNNVSARLVDYGSIMQPALGGKLLRLDRAGNRFAAEISFPPMKPDVSRIFVSRLLDAKSEGLRIEYPLLTESQGTPGSPVVNGAGQSGKTLAIRGLTAIYEFKEGYWLSIVDATGQHYLHNVRSSLITPGTGITSIAITPALRTPFADGAVINLAVPMIEGVVGGDEWSWQVPVDHLIALVVPIQEAA